MIEPEVLIYLAFFFSGFLFGWGMRGFKVRKDD